MLVAVAAIALTYLFCIRPMRRGSCHPAAVRADSQLAAELELARTELELLRLRQATSGGSTPPTSTPPTRS